MFVKIVSQEKPSKTLIYDVDNLWYQELEYSQSELGDSIHVVFKTPKEGSKIIRLVIHKPGSKFMETLFLQDCVVWFMNNEGKTIDSLAI